MAGGHRRGECKRPQVGTFVALSRREGRYRVRQR
jgi:hypothetical protein